MKTCGRCGTNKPMNAFGLRSDTRDGRQYKCLSCAKEYRESHKAEAKIANALWYIENSVHHRELQNAYRANNLYKWREAGDRRRALRFNATVGDMPDNAMAALISLYGKRCMYPGCTNTDLTVDHVIPLSKNGTHSIDNLQILCMHHNCSKGNRSCDDYRLRYTFC